MTVLFKGSIKTHVTPCAIYGLIADNYLDGLNLYQTLKDVPLDKMKVEIEFKNGETIYQVIEKENEQC